VVPEYPVEAIREAVINAICHRIYTESGTVQVRIYDDRLEVWNPGMLPSDLTIEQLYHEHASHPRNPRLAAAFHHAGLIERWGTGTLRIINATLAHGMGCPEFFTQSGMFIVRFRAVAARILPEGVTLNDRQQKALEYVREHGKISAGEYQRISGVKRTQAFRDLTELTQAGLLMLEKHGRSSYYVESK
jgi:ATP-dependent DNA helicase RecG